MTKLMMLLSAGISSDFIESLKIMGLGMLGIFVVMALIYLVIVLLGKLPSDEKKNKKDN